MKQLVNVLHREIAAQIERDKSNIVRVEGIDNPVVYQMLCSALMKTSGIDDLLPKLAKEKYDHFVSENKAEWANALSFLHQGKNDSFSDHVTSQYGENSYVDFDNAITKWRNESSNAVEGKTRLILLMGTEAAPDTGGLADTSFVISPKEIVASLSKDYSQWFLTTLEESAISDDCRKAIHTLYKAIFSQISTDIFKLSDFVDGLSGISFTSSQDVIAYICETLNTTWGIPSVIDKKYVPKVSALNKEIMSSAKIISSAIKFIERADDIPTASGIKAYEKKFEKYAEDNNIDIDNRFPEDNPIFDSYEAFQKTVLDFIRGINVDQNRKKLLKVDYAIINAIVSTKADGPIDPKKTIPSFSGVPIEVYSRMILDVVQKYQEKYKKLPTTVTFRVEKVTLSDCTEEQKEYSYSNICNFLGGILSFFNETAIEVEDQLLRFEYDTAVCDDPFDYANSYDSMRGYIKSSGKWGDPCKILYTLTASEADDSLNSKYNWSFSPYSAWLNAFTYMQSVLLDSKSTSYVLPTLISCHNMSDYLGCESEDEFYARMQQFRGDVLFDQHRHVIRQYFETSVDPMFSLICNGFKDFAVQITNHGFFNAGNELRALVTSYTAMMDYIHDHYSEFTDVQREKISLLLNSFTITSNENILSTGVMGDVIVPAYNPIMLEKLDAQQLYLMRGFKELFVAQASGQVTDAKVKGKLAALVQLSAITQAADIVRDKADKYLICQNSWEYFGVYYGETSDKDLLATSAVGLSIVTDDEDGTAMLQKTPMSSIIVRNVLDYLHTFPARVDGINISFVSPTNMQHIVAAIHTIAKQLENPGVPATINIKVVCLNSKKNSATYLRRWLDNYFSDERSVKVNTYLYNCTVNSISDTETLKAILPNTDICFTYNILQSSGVQFDPGVDKGIDINYEKFPMTFTPDTISATHGKARRVNISQPQFIAAKQHSQASHIAGYPHSIAGMYRVYRALELPEMQEEIVEIAHAYCKWVVCVDQAIDRNMLETNESKIIGFTTGEGSYGELNVTVSARKDILTDIKKMLRARITEKFSNWNADRLQRASQYCVDELSKYMDGSRILKALNPYDYEIHNFMAYILTLQMLGMTKQDDKFIVRTLISLDSYRHWFVEEDSNMRPDFLLIEIPRTRENLSEGEKLHINAKVIECKMAYKNDSHIAKAKMQLEKGIRNLSMNWMPEDSDTMQRYWLNQLYRAIIFSPLNLDNTTQEYLIVREKIYDILTGNYDIKWTGDIYAFWLDEDSDEHDVWELNSSVARELESYGIEVGELNCHSCGQLFIQKMLLPEEHRGENFVYNEIQKPEEDDDPPEQPVSPEQPTPQDQPGGKNEPRGDGHTIPQAKVVYAPFLLLLSDEKEYTRSICLKWFAEKFGITEEDQKLTYESNGHLKWETTFDSVISDFRRKGLLENSGVGAFHITQFGMAVLVLSYDRPELEFDELIRIASDRPWNQPPGSPPVEPPTVPPVEPPVTPPGEPPVEPPVNPWPKTPLEEIRVLIGKDKKQNPVCWEFGHPKLANRHILITGTSGQGKTYAIQTMLLELARQGISSVVFDYTDGFLPGKLEPEFEQELEGRITQEVAILNKIPANPFRLQTIEIPPFGSRPEMSTSAAGRISDILKHVYSFGDQQGACIYTACKDGIDQYGSNMSFAKLRDMLNDMGTPHSKSVLSKMAQFFDMDLFDSSREFAWEDIAHGDGKVTVIQLTGLDRELQTAITEIMMWDAWYTMAKVGNKNKPFVVVLDEAQNLSFKEKSPAEKILREGRKYGWSAWFATQFLKGALDSGEISNLQQAAERLYFKPTGEEMSYIAGQISDIKAESAEWYNTIKGLQKGQCIVQGGRLKPNGQFGGDVNPVVVSVSSFDDRK